MAKVKLPKKVPPAPPSVLVAVPRKDATEALWGPLMFDDLHAQAVEKGWPIVSSEFDRKLYGPGGVAGAGTVIAAPMLEWAIYRRALGGSWDGRAVLYSQTW